LFGKFCKASVLCVRTPIAEASFNAGVGSFTSGFNWYAALDTTGAPKDTARPRE